MAARRHEPGGSTASLWRARRRRCYEILERDAAHDRTAHRVEIGLIVLVVLNVIVAVLETVPSLYLRDYRAFLGFERLSLLVFALEYALRLWVAPENPRYRGLTPLQARLRYARTAVAIVDLIAWLPFVLSAALGSISSRWRFSACCVSSSWCAIRRACSRCSKCCTARARR